MTPAAVEPSLVQPPVEVRRSRITARVSVCYEGSDGRPVAAVAAGDRWLATDEQPYLRRLSVTPDWRPLDPGWLVAASLLVLEVQAQDPTACVEVGWLVAAPARAPVARTMHSPPRVPSVVEPVPLWLARPGTPLLAEPARLEGLHLRSLVGEVRVVLSIFPG